MKSNNNNKNEKQVQAKPKTQPSGRSRRSEARARDLARGDQDFTREGFSPLSPAATAYGEAIANPFDAAPCGIPNTPSLLTRKTKYWTKGTFTTSTDPAALGVGYVAVNPFAGMANDSQWVRTSVPANPNPAIDLVAVGETVGYNSNSEYTLASFGPQFAQKRVVACGLRIKNITANIQVGGKVIGLTEPTHASLSGFGEGGLNAFLETGILSGEALRKPLKLLWYPTDTNDTNMTSAFPADNAQNGSCMAFLCVAPSGLPQTYEFEAYIIAEIQGQNVTSKDLSIADSTGFEAVTNVMTAAHKLHKPHIEDPQSGKHMVAAAKHMVNHGQSSRAPRPKRRMNRTSLAVLSGC